jgi:two-component system LytT family sensor kinase
MHILKVRAFIIFERLLGFVLIPAISAVIPWAANIFAGKSITITITGYLLCLILGLTIWLGCRFLFFKTRFAGQYISSYTRFAYIYYPLAILYGFFVSYALFWYCFETVFAITLNISLFALIAVVLLLFISAIYEIFILYYESLSRHTENLELKKANWQSEINAIKARIEPHFLFNSLSTLQNLIIEDKSAANAFNLLLSQVYQQVLEMSNTDLTTVEKELQMTWHYFRLMLTRFPDAATMSLQVADFNVNRLLVPPLSLQLLIENAFKHNHFSREHPMEIKILVAKGAVTVTNTKSPVADHFRKSATGGNGLQILSERFRLMIQKEIKITDQAAMYAVRLTCKKIAS